MRLLILLTIATSALAADSCQSAKNDLDTFISTLPTACSADLDCTGRYMRADSCAAPVIVNRSAKVTDMQAFLKLRNGVRRACAAESHPARPVRPSRSARPVARANVSTP